jgi:hypothetical protein
VWGISTPTIPNYGIHRLYLGSTQEHFFFPCPACSRWTELVWPDCVEIVGEHVNDPRCKESYLKCKECGAKLEHKAKPEWLVPAEWQAHAADMESRGFYINQLYSFTVTPGEIVVAYFRGFGDELANKEFHNSKLGLPFVGEGAQLTDNDLQQCVASHTQDEPRPTHSGRLITLGVDQGKWSYYEVTEWFVEHMSRDINVAARAKVLQVGKFLEDEWDYVLDELMRQWQVVACVIDADPAVMEARRFARRFHGFVWLCRYRKGVTAKEISVSDDDDGAPVATVDRTNWLSAALGRFRVKRIQLPRDIPHEYLAHQKNLVRTYERDDLGNPKAIFKDTGPDHFAHARCYSEIALPLGASIVTNQDVAKFL